MAKENDEAWNGGLDPEEVKRPGGLLLAALVRTAHLRKQHLGDMARDLGVTYGYISQLRSGLRKVDQVSDGFAQACARYLGVPRLAVLQLSGRLRPEDFFEEGGAIPEITAASEFIQNDPQWGPLMTIELRALSPDSWYGIVRLYEEATGKKLLARRLDPIAFAKEVAKFSAASSEGGESLAA